MKQRFWGVLASSLLLAILGTTSLSRVTTAQSSQTPAIFIKAQKELPTDLYMLYRIVDRISRANGLDESPWRILLLDKYDINAFATEVNLIGIYSGILDQLAGDTSGLACLVGHEMAHHTHRHIALSKAQREARLQEIQAEAEAAVQTEIKRVQGQVTGNAVIGAILGVNTSGFSQQSIQAAESRIQAIKEKKEAEFKAEMLAMSRKNEFEADQTGYTYMAKAGFDPKGCLRLMAVLSRTENAEFDTTHPNVPARITAIEELMIQSPPQTLSSQGSSRIRATQPLTYDFSRDRVSLRINSRFGTSGQDFQRLFGQ